MRGLAGVRDDDSKADDAALHQLAAEAQAPGSVRTQRDGEDLPGSPPSTLPAWAQQNRLSRGRPRAARGPGPQRRRQLQHASPVAKGKGFSPEERSGITGQVMVVFFVCASEQKVWFTFFLFQELQLYLSDLANQIDRESGGEVPLVVIIDDISDPGAVTELINGALTCKYHKWWVTSRCSPGRFWYDWVLQVHHLVFLFSLSFFS